VIFAGLMSSRGGGRLRDEPKERPRRRPVSMRKRISFTTTVKLSNLSLRN